MTDTTRTPDAGLTCSALSHGLRNHLGAALTYATLVRKSVEDPRVDPRVLDDLGEITKALMNAVALVDSHPPVRDSAVQAGEVRSSHDSRSTASRRPSRHERGRILLVDDEAALRSATSRLLAARGYDVVEAGSGAAALAMVERRGADTLDVVLTDIAMPGLRGDELAWILKRRSPALPVVFMSGFIGEADLGGSHILRKPVSEMEMASALDRAISLR